MEDIQKQEIDRKFKTIMNLYNMRKSQEQISKELGIPISIVSQVTQYAGIHHTVANDGKRGLIFFKDLIFLLDYNF